MSIFGGGNEKEQSMEWADLLQADEPNAPTVFPGSQITPIANAPVQNSIPQRGGSSPNQEPWDAAHAEEQQTQALTPACPTQRMWHPSELSQVRLARQRGAHITNSNTNLNASLRSAAQYQHPRADRIRSRPRTEPSRAGRACPWTRPCWMKTLT